MGSACILACGIAKVCRQRLRLRLEGGVVGAAITTLDKLQLRLEGGKVGSGITTLDKKV